jgi:general secretion pathway protein K
MRNISQFLVKFYRSSWTGSLMQDGKKRQKGVALLMALFSTMIIFWLAMEISHETSIEYAVNSNSTQRVKAYYAAKAGVELSLLRIKIYNQIQSQIGQNKQIPPSIKSMIDLIWQFPLAWPPVLPPEVSDMEKEDIMEKVKEGKMEASFVTTITDEGTKIDLGDLDSPSKSLKDSARMRLMALFENKLANDEAFQEKHRDFRFEELVNNIMDWVDRDRESLNGGDESVFYRNPPPGIRLPPNRLFRTVEELRLVAGMQDAYFDILEKAVTVYGTRAVNPNRADSHVLKSLDPSITDKVVEEILQRRDSPNKGGPFTDAADFWNFVNASGARVSPDTQSLIPLTFEGTFNFRIKSVGMMGNATREIEAVVMDFTKVAASLGEQINKDFQTPGTNPPGPSSNNQSASKGRPRIVYWSEK